ncbi:MAG TPA: hypothetical protein VM282_26425 [Acidimicrobiales bacterium]|nr:hypothetical protein [Acidimicrobiales bacterium]
MTTRRFTVVQADGAVQVDATIDAAGATVRMSADAVQQCLGWERKPEGLCRGDVCIPARSLAGVEGDDGLFDLAQMTELLERPFAIDIEGAAAFVGVGAPQRAARLARFEAPDFTLPDLDGRLHSLTDHRGKKVFLATWASW